MLIGLATGNVTIYRKHNKPALGWEGDSLGDFDPPFGGSMCDRQ
jgi:hypothetical protein